MTWLLFITVFAIEDGTPKTQFLKVCQDLQECREERKRITREMIQSYPGETVNYIVYCKRSDRVT